MRAINPSVLLASMPDLALRRTSEQNVTDVLTALECTVHRYRVTVNLDGERMTYYCGSAGEVGALREAFEKVHGSSIDVVIMDQQQNRRIY